MKRQFVKLMCIENSGLLMVRSREWTPMLMVGLPVCPKEDHQHGSMDVRDHFRTRTKKSTPVGGAANSDAFWGIFGYPAFLSSMQNHL